MVRIKQHFGVILCYSQKPNHITLSVIPALTAGIQKAMTNAKYVAMSYVTSAESVLTATNAIIASIATVNFAKIAESV
jgi:hypothetical protein